MANSSATRTGFRIGMSAPSSAIFARSTRWVSAPAMHHRVRRQRHRRVVVLGNGDPVEAYLVGKLELLERKAHRLLGRFG